MTENEWIQVKDPQAQTSVTLTKGVLIELSVSPYDIPQAIRGGFDKRARRFIIEFRYLDTEPSEEVEAGLHARCTIGRYTKRIQAIKLDVDALDVDHIELKLEQVNDAIDTLSKLETSQGRAEASVENYALTRKVVQERIKDFQLAAG